MAQRNYSLNVVVTERGGTKQVQISGQFIVEYIDKGRIETPSGNLFVDGVALDANGGAVYLNDDGSETYQPIFRITSNYANLQPEVRLTFKEKDAASGTVIEYSKPVTSASGGVSIEYYDGRNFLINAA